MISATSRYKNATVTAGIDRDGDDIMLIQFQEPSDTTFKYTLYQVDDQTFIDVIASRFYGDPTQWWFIAQANPEILDWTNLIAGTIIRIPTIASLAATS